MGAQGRTGGPGLYRALSRLGDTQGRKLAEASQARQTASLTPWPNSSQRDTGDSHRCPPAPPTPLVQAEWPPTLSPAGRENSPRPAERGASGHSQDGVGNACKDLPGEVLVCACLVVSDSATSWPAALQAPLSMNFPVKNTGVGCHFLLQGLYVKIRYLILRQVESKWGEQTVRRPPASRVSSIWGWMHVSNL